MVHSGAIMPRLPCLFMQVAEFIIHCGCNDEMGDYTRCKAAFSELIHFRKARDSKFDASSQYCHSNKLS